MLASAGHTNRQIAREFNVSPRAIEFHLTSLYVKLGINRRAQLECRVGKGVRPLPVLRKPWLRVP